MALTIAVAGQKGGTGKTTVAVSLAVALLELGHRVLLVDADPQGSARTWADVAAEHGHPAPAVVSMGPGLHRPDQLPTLSSGFDVVLVDCPPSHGEILRAGLVVADLALLPCSPSPVDVWALGASLELVEQAQVIRPDLAAAIVINRKDPRTALGRGVREALEGNGVAVLRAELANRVAYAEALLSGQGVTTYQPGGLAALEVATLADEVLALVGGKDQARVA